MPKRIRFTRRETVQGYDDRGRPWRRTFAAGKVVALDDEIADRALQAGAAVPAPAPAKPVNSAPGRKARGRKAPARK